MQSVTLQSLLEAGCHFGHKAERWHPRAAEFIYVEKDGIHIIDLVKTRSALISALEFVREITASGGEVLFVGTKRQAKSIVAQASQGSSAPYMTERWIGGFLTNWEGIQSNIKKINRMDKEQAENAWRKFPKHEQFKLARYLKRLKVYYGGVLQLSKMPQAVFVVDIKKEDAAVREAKRLGIPIVGIVDTNSDPTDIDYVIPANDDAVGSIQLLVDAMIGAYAEGKAAYTKNQADTLAKEQAAKAVPEKAVSPEEKPKELAQVEAKPEVKPESKSAETPAKKKRTVKKSTSPN